MRSLGYLRIGLQAILFCWVLAPQNSYSQEPSEKLRVGIPLPLSGGLAASGEDLRDSFIVAKELLKADNVELLFEDDGCDGKRSVSVAHKLLEIDKVDAVSGIYCNHALLPAGPVYNRKGISVVSTGATTGDVKGIGKRIFRLFPADHFALDPLVQVITKNHKRLCMLTALDAYTELMQRTVKRKYANLVVPFTLIAEDIEPGVNDYRSAMLKMLSKGCDAFYLNSPGDDVFIVMVRQLRQIHQTMPIYAVYNPGSSTVISALGDKLNGIVFADLPSRSDLATKLGMEFLEAYEKRFGQFRTAQPLGLLAFEAVRLITAAWNAKRPVDEYVRNIKISDGAIKEYSFDEDGAIEGISFKVMRHQDGQAKEVDRS
jgi:ABC-type branched-subunit amino acid transport system substrate-binding protein